VKLGDWEWMILFFNTLFLILIGDSRCGQLLPAAITSPDEACWAATAAWIGLPDALAPSTTAKAASFLHVNAHVDPNAPNRNCLLLIIDSITLTSFPLLLLTLICLPYFEQNTI
jgi:hypothetical protein